MPTWLKVTLIVIGSIILFVMVMGAGGYTCWKDNGQKPDAGCPSRGPRGTPVRGRQGQRGLHGGGGQAHQGYLVLGCRRGEALPRKLPQSRQPGSRILRRRAGPDRAFEIHLLAGAFEPKIRAPSALRVSRPAAIDHRLLRVSTGTAAKVTACPGWPCVHPKSAASGQKRTLRSHLGHVRFLPAQADIYEQPPAASAVAMPRRSGAGGEAGTRRRKGSPQSDRNRSRHRQIRLLCPRSAHHPIDRKSVVSSADM